MKIKLKQNWESLLLAIVIGLLLHTVWYFQFFPTIDGPSHLANAINIKNLLLGRCELVQQFYSFTPTIVPNWLGHAVMATLSFIFTPQISEKLLISLYIVCFSLGLRAFITTINPHSRFLLFTAVNFVFSLQLFAGNYNFLLSLSIYLFALSWWLTNRNHLSIKHFLITTFLFLLLYITHLMGTIAFAFSIFTICCFDLAVDKNFPKFLRIGVYHFLSAMPVMVLFYAYWQLPKIHIDGNNNLSFRLLNSLFATALYSLSGRSIPIVVFFSAFVWILFVCCAWRQLKSGEFYKHAAMLLLSLGFFLCVIFFPSSLAGGWSLEPRFQLFMWITLIGWLATLDYSNKVQYLLTGIALIFFLATLFVTREALYSYNKVLKEFASINTKLPDHSVIFAVDISPFTINYENSRTNTRTPVSNITGYLTANSCSVEVSNYHAAEKNTFPISYKDSLNPYLHLGKFRTINSLPIIPPKVDIAKYESETGIAIDYVIIRGKKENRYHYNLEVPFKEEELYDNFMVQIDNLFVLDYSSGFGLAKVYKRRK